MAYVGRFCMAVKICEHIGICRMDEDGNIAELQREFFGQGRVFKDWENAGEIDTCEKCGKLFMAYNIKKCPYCKGRNIRKLMLSGTGVNILSDDKK